MDIGRQRGNPRRQGRDRRQHPENGDGIGRKRVWTGRLSPGPWIGSWSTEPRFLPCWSLHDGHVVGQCMITTEFSDWKNGEYWWVQSIYVGLEHRRKGVLRAILEEIRRMAKDKGDVFGIRLYVDKDNDERHRGLSSTRSAPLPLPDDGRSDVIYDGGVRWPITGLMRCISMMVMRSPSSTLLQSGMGSKR